MSVAPGRRTDVRLADLAEPGVRDADDRHVRHVRVQAEELFDLGRVRVEAADDEHVLDAVGDAQVARRRRGRRRRPCAASRPGSMAVAVVPRGPRSSRCITLKPRTRTSPGVPGRRQRRGPPCRGSRGPRWRRSRRRRSPRRHIVTMPLASERPYAVRTVAMPSSRAQALHQLEGDDRRARHHQAQRARGRARPGPGGPGATGGGWAGRGGRRCVRRRCWRGPCPR